MNPTISPNFDCYLRGFLHSLYQQGYEEYDAFMEMQKLTGIQVFSEEDIKECYRKLKEGNYLIVITSGQTKEEDEEKWWITKMASWAYKGVSGYLGYNGEGPLTTPLTRLLKPRDRNEITIDSMVMLIGPAFFELHVDDSKKKFEQNGNKCIMTCGEDVENVGKVSMVSVVAEYLREIFEDPDLRIRHWRVAPYYEIWKEDPAYKQNESKMFTMIDAILRSIEQYQKVETFQLDTDLVSHLVYFLPYFKPRILKKVVVHNRIPDFTRETENILDMEQFKKLEEFHGAHLDMRWDIFSYKFTHLTNCSMKMKMSCDQVAGQAVVEKLLKNPKLDKYTIEIGTTINDVGSVIDMFRLPEPPSDTLRPWRFYEYSGRNKGKKLQCNLDKNVLIFMGPMCKEPPMDCHV